MLIFALVRGALQLVTVVPALYLLVGFIGQFPAARRYPWILDIWNSLTPLRREIARQLPTIFNRIDYAMLEVLAAVLIAYFIVISTVNSIEAAIIRARKARQTKVSASAAPEQGKAQSGAAAAKPANATKSTTPAVSVPDGSRVYRSEVLVVLDLVNSTGLVTRLGNALLATMKERLERVVTPLCQRQGASYIKSTGDGFLVTFTSMAQGMTALRQIFAALDSMNEGLPDGAELALRASVNIGEVIVERDSDRTGGAVHKTFRLQSVDAGDLIEAEGGIKREAFPITNYVIASEEAQSGMHRVPGFECRFLGLCELKGFPGLHRVYHLQWPLEGATTSIEVVPVTVPRRVAGST